ncbi:MAG: glycine cleavage system aminomethyltransferase GcvT [Pseudomonadota bacterium]
MSEIDPGLKRTPLHDLHIALDAKMVAFAGYAMPVQYPLGVMKEHLTTRENAGLFDVSHMGQVRITPRSGDLAEAALAMERLVPIDVLGLKNGRQRYAMFTNDAGGIQDDLMVTNAGDHLYVVVNAACKEQDLEHLRAEMDECLVDEIDAALLALQGPRSEAALATLAPEVIELGFMESREVSLLGEQCRVSRSGYSGEDGFEVSAPNRSAVALAQALLESHDVAPVGLGARDSLRLEAGLCLYGSDIDVTTSPIEAGLKWAIQRSRRAGGAREGNFPGAGRILSELEQQPQRLRVGLKPDGRAPMRHGTPLFAEVDSSEPCGRITSGGFGPSVGAPISMGYVPSEMADTGTRLFGEVRGKRLPVKVAEIPFVANTYKR